MPLIINPDMGLNSLVASTALDLREAAKGSQNVVYEYGILRTPYGISKLDLTSGLNSGDTILSIFQWRELDEATHVMAVTTEKIYDHDRINNEWDDKTQSGVTMDSNETHPISFAEVGHDDTDIYLDDDNTKSNAYHHVIICDGGMSNIQRWAGRWEADFANLTGGNGYHDGTTHRALQVSMSKVNRVILLSPQTYNSSTNIWTENNQTIQWPVIGRIQTWTGTGSGSANLLDTGGTNVWSESLGSDHIIYQTCGIWSINYVGGSQVFDPRPVIPDLGLLSYHLISSYNNVHYFLGTDYNIHAYYGGTVISSIGDKIHKYLQEDLDPQYKYRCWLVMGTEGKYLWVVIVPSGSEYATKVYRRNMQTGSWHVRDFSSKWTSGGITAICLSGAESYIIGDSYDTELDTLSSYDISDAGDCTTRYADFLLDTSRTLAADYTAGTWSAGGVDYSKNGENFHNDFTENDILMVVDGSNATNVRWGNHFYTAYDVSANGFSIYWTEDRATNQYHGIADASNSVPADLSVAGTDIIRFYSVCSDDSPGATYNQELDEIFVSDKILLGDNGGYIYKVDPTYTDDDGSNMDCRHLMPVLDWGKPGIYKRWPGARVTAKGTSLTMRQRIGNFDTSDTGWTDYTQALTSEYVNYEFPLNLTSKKIQWEAKDFSGDDFEISDLEIMEPVIESNR